MGSRFAIPATRADKDQPAMDKGKSGDDKSSDSVIIFDGKEPNRAAHWNALGRPWVLPLPPRCSIATYWRRYEA